MLVTKRRKFWLPKGENAGYPKEKLLVTKRRKCWLPKGQIAGYQKEKLLVTKRRNCWLPKGNTMLSKGFFSNDIKSQNCVVNGKFVFRSLVGTEESASYLYFTLFSQCFPFSHNVLQKLSWKRRKCYLPIFSPFLTMFPFLSQCFNNFFFPKGI